jgi:hypothetical protein
MKRSMIQRRQDAERERKEAFDTTLRRAVHPSRPTPDFRKALEEAERGCSGEVVRDPASWHPQMKTRDAGRLRLAAARHLFAVYPVPAMLEHVWIDDAGLATDEVRLRRQWYVVAARGGSLYKSGAAEWLTRKEVHAFLNPPAGLGFEQAFWQAIARSYTDDSGLAMGLARSKIARVPRGEIVFWREAARFFCVHPARTETVDDLCDYLVECRRRDRGYRIHGRTPATLHRGMREWHRDLAVLERIEAIRLRARWHGGSVPDNAAWPGLPLADWEWAPSARNAKARDERFVVSQLKRAEDLMQESSAMRHCVWSYAAKCIAGHVSIWSLRHCTKEGTARLLTIEVDDQRRAVQVRGFANRLAHADERQVLERWAKARAIDLK